MTSRTHILLGPVMLETVEDSRWLLNGREEAARDIGHEV